MGTVGDDSGCYNLISTSQMPSYVFRFLFSTIIFSELKIVTSFSVKSVEQSEFHICPIYMMLVIFKFGYEWDCVDADGNVGRGKWP